METIIWMNNKENKFRLQDLKNQEVFWSVKDNNANGVSKIKILIITYLNEYVKTKLSKDIVSEALIIPSKENISREEESIEILLFISKINSEKQIFLWNRDSPIPLIAREILETKFKICSIKKYEKLIQIPQITNLKINWEGLSTCW